MDLAWTRSLRHWMRQYRRTWRGSALGSFVVPLLNLSVLGFGLGALVKTGSQVTTDYVSFVAPALLAAAALQTASAVATFPVVAAMRGQRVYQAMAMTPLRPLDILLGHLAFMTLRVLLTAVVFSGFLVCLGLLTVGSAVLALGAATLCGLGTAAPVTALAAHARNDAAIPILMRFVITPMFLFCGTLYPVTLMPAAVRPVIWLTPLYHGIELCRGFARSGLAATGVAWHVLVLGAWLAGGVMLAERVFRKRLAQ
ncbi:MAG: ABC transporter permease [Frankiaceae bacterium]